MRGDAVKNTDMGHRKEPEWRSKMENNENKTTKELKRLCSRARRRKTALRPLQAGRGGDPGNDKTENAPGAEAKSGEVKKYRRPAQRRTVTAQERRKRTLFLVQLGAVCCN